MSRADRFTELDRKNELYSDFLTNLNTHPVSRETLRFVNETAVTRSIRNLLNTQQGERLYQPDIGSNVRKLLFEPIDDVTSDILTSTIRDTLTAYEPRAKVLNVEVVPDEERNRYVVTVVYMLINKQDPISVNITLQRVR
jgi:uncharacterized protein